MCPSNAINLERNCLDHRRIHSNLGCVCVNCAKLRINIHATHACQTHLDVTPNRTSSVYEHSATWCFIGHKINYKIYVPYSIWNFVNWMRPLKTGSERKRKTLCKKEFNENEKTLLLFDFSSIREHKRNQDETQRLHRCTRARTLCPSAYFWFLNTSFYYVPRKKNRLAHRARSMPSNPFVDCPSKILWKCELNDRHHIEMTCPNTHPSAIRQSTITFWQPLPSPPPPSVTQTVFLKISMISTSSIQMHCLSAVIRR